jgi:hypothetical protein
VTAALRRSALVDAPVGAPPAGLLWAYAGLFGTPAAYRFVEADRPVAWVCGARARGAARFEALPERLYGLLPEPGAVVDLDALRAAFGTTGVQAEIVCAPLGTYRAADLRAYHRLDTFLVSGVGPEELFGRLARVGRQGVRRAERAGVTVRGLRLAAGLEEHHALYARKCARHGAPARPRAFFDRLAAAFGSDAQVFLADHDGAPVAAALVVRAGDYAIFADGSSREDVWDLCPNNLVVWRAARACLEAGARVLDYGLSPVGVEGDARFKTHLGGVRTPVYVVTT